VHPGTVFHLASLTKQLTAACVALLVQQGRLDTASPLAQWLPELPAWAARVRVRHLLHHTSGLPDVAGFDELERAGLDRTTGRVMGALGCPTSPASTCSSRSACGTPGTGRARHRNHLGERRSTPLGRPRCPWGTVVPGRPSGTCCAGTSPSTTTSSGSPVCCRPPATQAGASGPVHRRGGTWSRLSAQLVRLPAVREP